MRGWFVRFHRDLPRARRRPHAGGTADHAVARELCAPPLKTADCDGPPAASRRCGARMTVESRAQPEGKGALSAEAAIEFALANGRITAPSWLLQRRAGWPPVPVPAPPTDAPDPLLTLSVEECCCSTLSHTSQESDMGVAEIPPWAPPSDFTNGQTGPLPAGTTSGATLPRSLVSGKLGPRCASIQ